MHLQKVQSDKTYSNIVSIISCFFMVTPGYCYYNAVSKFIYYTSFLSFKKHTFFNVSFSKITWLYKKKL
jgi:hypothetical protein